MAAYCMKSLWLCYFAINVSWFILRLIYEGYRRGIFQQTLLPMAFTFLVYLVNRIVLLGRKKELHSLSVYLMLNLFVILLLMHPSRQPILDGLMFGVIVMFPVWDDQKWAKLQAAVFVGYAVARHLILYFGGFRLTGYWQITNLVGMFCLGGMLYYNVRYVHDQTVLLGDATRMDAATGLYNHEYFYEELERRMHTYGQLTEKEREEGSFCLLIADIDNFKKVNDTYGHAFGDEVLLGLANIFKNYCGGKDFAARYGGEEFVLIVGACHKKDALTRANTIRKKFADTVFADATGEEHQFTVSLGVAEYDRPWDTASKFFDQSDQALYQAKNTGKNRVCSA
jgi:diguanylate cyclase (GGDEF)-like protein